MKRKVRFKADNLSQALDRFERTWQRAAKAGAGGTEVRLQKKTRVKLRVSARGDTRERRE